MKRVLFASAVLLSGAIMTSCGTSEDEAAALENDLTAALSEASEDLVEEKTTYSINAENSVVKWTGSMLGMYEHTGTLNVTEGSLVVEGGNIVGGSITVDMTSMTPTDENFNPEEGKTPDKLVGHLSSADFFDIENNPTASFAISGGESGSVSGTLTLKGNTGNESVSDVTVNEENGTVTASGNLTVNRQNYGVTWAHPVKENVLGDDLKLSIELSGSKE